MSYTTSLVRRDGLRGLVRVPRRHISSRPTPSALEIDAVVRRIDGRFHDPDPGQGRASGRDRGRVGDVPGGDHGADTPYPTRTNAARVRLRVRFAASAAPLRSRRTFTSQRGFPFHDPGRRHRSRRRVVDSPPARVSRVRASRAARTVSTCCPVGSTKAWLTTTRPSESSTESRRSADPSPDCRRNRL